MRSLSINIIISILLVALFGCTSSLTPGSNNNQTPLSALSSASSFSLTQTPNDPLYSQQDYLNTANVPYAWQNTTGSPSQKIAIISVGGINENHEDLSSRLTVKTSSNADISANNPLAGIMGAATNNGVGVAGVNWDSPILSYDVGEEETKQVTLPSGISVEKTFIGLNTGSVASNIDDAVNSGSKTILMPLNWVQENQLPNFDLVKLQYYPEFKVEGDPKQLILNAVWKVLQSVYSQDNDYSSAVSAVKDAYLDGSVVVGKAIEYNGTGIGFPANLASDHIAFTVGAYNNVSLSSYEYSSTPEATSISYDTDDINVIAPGINMLTTLYGNTEYGEVSGTSASAALSAGIISLLQAANPSLTPDDIAHILEKTASPIGGGGYDNKSGFGIIDAGAALDYVTNNEIKHGTSTDTQIEQVASNRKITLFSSAWKEVASGTYFADIHKVTYTIPLVPSSTNDLWFNAKGTLGWSAANPNSQNRYAKVELFSDHATVTTYIYDIISNISGETSFGWYPAGPSEAQLSYSYVGEIPPEPLSTTISGIPYVNDGQSAAFTANVSNAKGAINYQWYYRQEPYSSWISGGTGSSFTHTFYSAPGGETAHSAVKVVVNSAGETASDIHSVDVYGCQGLGGSKSVDTNIIIPC